MPTDTPVPPTPTDVPPTPTDTSVPPTPTDTPVPPAPKPTPDVALETGTVATVNSGGWTTVLLSRSYDAMVVVASANYDRAEVPGTLRIRNAAGNSFEVRVASTNGSAVDGVGVHYVVVEEGVYTVADHGVKMEAHRFASTRTDSARDWSGQGRSYSNSYARPVVVGQVMTYNDPAFSTFWARGANRLQPPSGQVLYVGKHVGEDRDTTRLDEEIGYIVIEAGSGTIGDMAYTAELGNDKIRGVGNSPPYGYSLNGLSSPSVAIISQAAMKDSNGGWAILYGASPLSSTRLGLAIDEDQAKDKERKHSGEHVAYIVFD